MSCWRVRWQGEHVREIKCGRPINPPPSVLEISHTIFENSLRATGPGQVLISKLSVVHLKHPTGFAKERCFVQGDDLAVAPRISPSVFGLSVFQ